MTGWGYSARGLRAGGPARKAGGISGDPHVIGPGQGTRGPGAQREGVGRGEGRGGAAQRWGLEAALQGSGLGGGGMAGHGSQAVEMPTVAVGR